MKTQRSFRTVMVHATLLGLACLASGDALATSGVLSAFNARYPGSTTSTSAGCNTCHGGSTSTFNAYGRDLAPTAAAPTALPLAPSQAIESVKADQHALRRDTDQRGRLRLMADAELGGEVRRGRRTGYRTGDFGQRRQGQGEAKRRQAARCAAGQRGDDQTPLRQTCL